MEGSLGSYVIDLILIWIILGVVIAEISAPRR